MHMMYLDIMCARSKGQKPNVSHAGEDSKQTRDLYSYSIRSLILYVYKISKDYSVNNKEAIGFRRTHCHFWIMEKKEMLLFSLFAVIKFWYKYFFSSPTRHKLLISASKLLGQDVILSLDCDVSCDLIGCAVSDRIGGMCWHTLTRASSWYLGQYPAYLE